jgi:hypothetical protein
MLKKGKHMDLTNLDKAEKKMGGRFKTVALMQKRIKELLGTGMKPNAETLADKIIDEINNGDIVPKYVDTSCDDEK